MVDSGIRKPTESQLMKATKKLRTLKRKKGSTVSEFVTEFKNAAEKIKALGGQLYDADLQLTLLEAVNLPNEMDKVNVKTAAGVDGNFEKIKEALLRLYSETTDVKEEQTHM